MTTPRDTSPKKAPASVDRRHVYTYALVLIVVGFGVYVTSFDGVFLFDDIPHIVEGQTIRRLWPPGDLLRSERALLYLTLAVNYAVHGLKVWGYHLVNTTIHVLVGLTLFGLARRTLLTPRCRARFGEDAATVAFFAALIWIVHPLGTQAVTYIIQRGEALMSLFYLLTLYGLVRAESSRRRGGWYTVSIMSCALGMASKAVMVTAPLVALLYDRTFLGDGFRDTMVKRYRVHLLLMAGWSVLFALGIVQEMFRTTPDPYAQVGFSHTHVTPWQYAATQPGVILHYLRLVFWPTGQCLDYGWPVATTLREMIPPAIVIVILLISAIWGTIRRSTYGFLAAAFFLILLPTSSFIPIRDLAFEHRMYLPLAAVVSITVGGVYRLVASRSIGAFDRNRNGFRIAAGVGLVAAVALGLVTVQRHRAYASEEIMWRDVAAKRPENFRAYVGIGYALHNAGAIDEALTYYNRALALEPNYADAWFNVGLALEAKGDVDGAVHAFEQAVRFAPQRLVSYEALARLYSKTGRPVQAASWFERLTELESRKAKWFYELGNAQSDAGLWEPAIRSYETATELDPGHVESWINLGNALRRSDRANEAIEAYERAVAVDGGSSIAWVNLGHTLASLGRTEEAVIAFERALTIDPASTQTHVGLGWTFYLLGRVDEAEPSFRRAIELDPANESARRGLAAIHKQRSETEGSPVP